MASELASAERPDSASTTGFTWTLTIRFLQIHLSDFAGLIPNGEAGHRRQTAEGVRCLRSFSLGICFDINLPNDSICHLASVDPILSVMIRQTLARETPSRWLMSHWLRPS